MRDINRIDILLEKFRELWMLNPDLRFGQLFNIIRSKITNTDGFYIEDDIVQTAIEQLLEYNKGENHGRKKHG
jgi:hypothetical protein